MGIKSFFGINTNQNKNTKQPTAQPGKDYVVSSFELETLVEAYNLKTKQINKEEYIYDPICTDLLVPTKKVKGLKLSELIPVFTQLKDDAVEADRELQILHHVEKSVPDIIKYLSHLIPEEEYLLVEFKGQNSITLEVKSLSTLDILTIPEILSLQLEDVGKSSNIMIFSKVYPDQLLIYSTLGMYDKVPTLTKLFDSVRNGIREELPDIKAIMYASSCTADTVKLHFLESTGATVEEQKEILLSYFSTKFKGLDKGEGVSVTVDADTKSVVTVTASAKDLGNFIPTDDTHIYLSMVTPYELAISIFSSVSHTFYDLEFVRSLYKYISSVMKDCKISVYAINTDGVVTQYYKEVCR